MFKIFYPDFEFCACSPSAYAFIEGRIASNDRSFTLNTYHVLSKAVFVKNGGISEEYVKF